jgi:hypothetical protein
MRYSVGVNNIWSIYDAEKRAWYWNCFEGRTALACWRLWSYISIFYSRRETEGYLKGISLCLNHFIFVVVFVAVGQFYNLNELNVNTIVTFDHGIIDTIKTTTSYLF